VGFTEGSIPLRPPTVDEIIEGGREPAEIWAEVATAALGDGPVLAFPEPEIALVDVEVDVSRLPAEPLHPTGAGRVPCLPARDRAERTLHRADGPAIG
jgi:hypothetical protein